MSYGSVNVPGASGPQLDAVRRIAEDALTKANKAIEDGGNAGCILKITFDAGFRGQSYTVTDGSSDTKNGTVSQNLVEYVKVKNFNTEYTVSSTSNRVSYSNTVRTSHYAGQYEVNLSVFSATLRVTADSGSRVTVTGAGDTHNETSNGTAVFTIKKPGTYTITATKDNATSSRVTANVQTNGSIVNSSVQFMKLTVTMPSGASLSVRNGNTNLTKSSTGRDTFYIPRTGNWTISATKNQDSATNSVNVTEYREYQVSLSFVKIYGASWDGTSTTRWTRTDDSANFVDPTPAIGNGSGSSPFDNCMPWSGMVKSQRTGGTMVAIPKFWYKLTQSGSRIKIQIADKQTSGFYVSPAHMDRGDGRGERNIVYIGRYHCDSRYTSTSGTSPLVNVTRTTARESIQNIGNNTYIIDFAMLFTLWLLYIVEFADWNSQKRIGFGGGNGSTERVGRSDSMTYHTGTPHSSRDTTGVGVQYRNIEGLWDNVLDWVDGCYYNSSGFNIIMRTSQFSDQHNGTLVSAMPSSGFPSRLKIAKGSNTFNMFLPESTGGSDATYTCDYWSYHASSPCIAFGGYYHYNSYSGLFYVTHYGRSGYSYIGCRLQELP